MKKLKEIYKAAGILLLNTLVLIVFLNIFLGISFFIKDRLTTRTNNNSGNLINEGGSQKLFNEDGSPVDNGHRFPYQLKSFDFNAYEGIADQEYVSIVLDEFYYLGSKLGFIYQPWVQFSEAPFNGKLVNVDVDPRGFTIRRTLNPKKNTSDVINVFILGGSTTFGYNVSDEHTWPTYLSDILNSQAETLGLDVNFDVVNYGRGWYNPSQEAVLFIDLLKSGHRPDLVLFMDGVNWGPEQDVPHLTEKFSKQFYEMQFSPAAESSIYDRLKWIPMIRLTNSLKRKLLKNASANQQIADNNKPIDKDDYIKQVTIRFNENRRIISQISDLYGVDVIFFLQPDARYNYPVDLYRMRLHDSELEQRRQRQLFYPRMKESVGYIDLTNLFSLWGSERKAVVDNVHYSPGFNRFLAQNVAKFIDLENLAIKSKATDNIESTGQIRHPESMRSNLQENTQ